MPPRLKPAGSKLDLLGRTDGHEQDPPQRGSWLNPSGEPPRPARPFLFCPVFWNDLGDRPGDAMEQAAAHHDVSMMIDARQPHIGQHELTMRPTPGKSYWITVVTQNYGVVPSFAATFELHLLTRAEADALESGALAAPTQPALARLSRPVPAYPPTPAEAGSPHTEFSIEVTWPNSWQQDDEWSLIAVIYDLLDPPTARWQPTTDRHIGRLDGPADIQ
jgi:hypothetical protein